MADVYHDHPTCRRGHQMSGDNLVVRWVRHPNGSTYRRRECRTCRNELERLRYQRRHPQRYRRKLPAVEMRDVVNRDEELAMLVEDQRRDNTSDVQPPTFNGRKVYSLDDDLSRLPGVGSDTNTHPAQDWWVQRSIWDE